MKTFLLFIAICYCNFSQGQFFQSSFKQLAQVNAQWYNQTSVNQALYIETAKPLSEHALIQYHLQQTELLLRSKDVSNLTAQQKLQRLSNLNVLHTYAAQGIFPVNDKFKKRTPFFIDKLNSYCAVGYLMKMSGADKMAKEIHATQNNSYLPDIHHEELKKWIEKSGLTGDELALIQPGYALDKAAFLLEMHYNNNGADVNEYIEFMQSSGEYINMNGGEVSKILFYNESNILYKTLLVSQMQSVTLPQIIYQPFYIYNPRFYYYTFPVSENFADAGRIEFKGSNLFSGLEVLCNEITYNASSITSKDYWNYGYLGEPREVTKTHLVGESETTNIGSSLTFSGDYSPFAIPPSYTTYSLNNWSASLLPATPGSVEILTVLPVTLSSFSGNVSSKTITLNWETLNEINASYFDIERSADGLNFETIGKVNSIGNSTTTTNYRFVDRNPLPINYYRLKQVDINGRIGYSKIIFLKVEQQNPITIFENPVKNNLQINVNIDQSIKASLAVFDFSGRKILTQRTIGGLQNIDVSKLTAGQYVIQLSLADGNSFTKVFQKGN